MKVIGRGHTFDSSDYIVQMTEQEIKAFDKLAAAVGGRDHVWDYNSVSFGKDCELADALVAIELWVVGRMQGNALARLAEEWNAVMDSKQEESE